jgi:hypothetical protein
MKEENLIYEVVKTSPPSKKETVNELLVLRAENQSPREDLLDKQNLLSGVEYRVPLFP